MRQHVIELILFSTYAELRAERARNYLGIIWWVLEPAMMMGAFWLVFDVILKTGGPDNLAFLLTGLTMWQWMKSCITHGGYAIWSNLNLIRQARLPLIVFPLVQMLADTVKFFFIFLLLVVILWLLGHPPNKAWAALPVIFVAIFLFAAGGGFILAAIVPFVPDVRFVIEQVLTVVMFLSGVVFALNNMPEHVHAVMQWNPVAGLVDATRGVVMYGRWPDWTALAKVAGVSALVLALGIAMIVRLTPRYPKLAA